MTYRFPHDKCNTQLAFCMCVSLSLSLCVCNTKPEYNNIHCSVYIIQNPNIIIFIATTSVSAGNSFHVSIGLTCPRAIGRFLNQKLYKVVIKSLSNKRFCRRFFSGEHMWIIAGWIHSKRRNRSAQPTVEKAVRASPW